MSITWDQFKEAVDKELKDADMDGSATVSYIDTSYPDIGDGWNGISIRYDKENNEFIVSN